MDWLNPPPDWSEADGRLRLVTAPRTDFWRKTHYGFVRDTGHFRHTTVSGDFTATVRIEGSYRDQYDQAGLMLRLNAETWVKTGIEFVDGRQWVSAVITRGLSDWSVAPLAPAPKALWVEVHRAGETIQIFYGPDRPDALLRVGALTPRPTVDVGLMAASPDGGGFSVVLSEFSIEKIESPKDAGSQAEDGRAAV